MQGKDSLHEGWDFSAHIMGGNYGSLKAGDYVQQVDDAVKKLVDDMNALGENGLGVKQLKGFVAEYWHTDTFNIEAALRDSSNRAFVEGSTENASVDVSTNFGKNYSLKYRRSAEKSVNEQAKNVINAYHGYLSKPRKGNVISFEEYLEKYGYSKDENIKKLIADYRKAVGNGDKSTLEQYMMIHAGEYDIASLLTSVYNGQDRLIPIDQINEAKKYLKQEIAKESEKETSNRAAVLANYKETLDKLVDRVSDGTGAESRTLTKEEAEAIAALVKEGQFKAEDFGLTLNDLITTDYILQQTLKAGYTAATITLVLQLAPEIIKAIDYLIKNGQIDLNQVKKIGVKAITAPTEGFLRGSISSALTIACKSGKLGASLVDVSPQVIGALTVITLDTVKNSFLVAVGKMDPQEMGATLTKEIIVSGMGLAGGAIAQSLVPEMPVLAYMLGSFVGSALASVSLAVGEKALLSFCVETGFTCFGLVKQDYSLPESVLEDMGLEIVKVERVYADTLDVDRVKPDIIEVDRCEYDTIEITILKRGIIGVNKIGYVL